MNSNGNNFNQQHSEDIENKLEMLINENQNLREMLENQGEIDHHQHEDQTESLVNVLEELISSFKNIEMKYESEIK